jgi:hypothetical protein
MPSYLRLHRAVPVPVASVAQAGQAGAGVPWCSVILIFHGKNGRATIPKPYGEDIILNVFQKINKDRELLRRYTLLKDELGKYGVNPSIGKYTKELTGMKNLKRTSAPNGPIITSYTKLVH